MYLSLNFRWPLMMGNNSNTTTATPVANSAFKSITATSCPTSLPPISTCLKDTNALLPSLPHLTPQVHSSLCPQYMQHSDSSVNFNPALNFNPAANINPGMKDMGCLTSPPTAMAAAAAAAASSTSHPGPPHPTHPAFGVSMAPWMQHTHPQMYNMNHLQQLIGNEKAYAVSQYLNDPLAKAALMDLGRMGQYPLGKKLFGCPQCRYITDRKNNLKRHIATMHQECDKLLECCGVVFKNKASLRDHVLIFHSNGYMCRYCGRNFCRKALLKRHLTVHSGQKDYVCPMCDYATSHKSNLERHKKVHERQIVDSDEHQTDSHKSEMEKPMHSTEHQNGHSENSRSVTSSPSLHDLVHTLPLYSHISHKPLAPVYPSSASRDKHEDLLGFKRVAHFVDEHNVLSSSDTDDISADDIDLHDIDVDVDDDQASALIDVVNLAN